MSLRFFVFGRAPEQGRVKTRLQSRLTAPETTQLYQAFFDDVIDLAPSYVETEVWVSGSPEARKALGERYTESVVRFQGRGSLGDRLANAFERGFGDGARAIVIVGSDHPTLPASRIEQAFDALSEVDVVLGPARDGGYYAIGLRREAWPRAEAILLGAPWSESGLFVWTVGRLHALGLRHTELESWYDIDIPEDLELMEKDLKPASATTAVWAKLSGRTPAAASRLPLVGRYSP